MDISKASNFERFIFDLLGRDAARTRRLFGEQLAQEGRFTLSAADFSRIAEFGFMSGRSTHADRLAAIRCGWQERHELVDPHTADGLHVAGQHLEPGVPMIVLETALPAKFGATLREAIGIDPPLPPALRDLESRPRRFEVMPKDAGAIKRYIAAHDPS
jgi:threonine synthase